MKSIQDTRGENNNSWKGDKAGYSAKHKYVVSVKGLIERCEHCGRNDKRRYDWANKDHKYRRNPDDYMRLCVSCHRKYDQRFKKNLKKVCVICGKKYTTKTFNSIYCSKECKLVRDKKYYDWYEKNVRGKKIIDKNGNY